MKRILTLAFLLAFAIKASTQSTPAAPAYLRFPTYPPLKLLLPDSSSYFTKEDLKKKSAVLLMVFNPSCDHCQHETEDIIKNIDSFKHVQIVMATMMSFPSMMAFREKYKLGNYSNIIVGQDISYFLPGFYLFSNMPFLAFYNKKKELISVHEGSMRIERVLAELEK